MISKTKQENISWIDMSKAIGIFLVVFGHCLQTFKLTDIAFYNGIWQFIYLFHMPLFFILAGYLYKPKSKQENLTKIIYCLLIPYFIYQVFYFPFQYGNRILIQHLDVFSTFIQMFKGMFLGDGYGYFVCLPCWFIISMIQIRLLFLCIETKLKNLLLITVFSLIALKYLFIMGFDLIFCLDNTIMALPYFIFGIVLKNFLELKQPNTCIRYQKYILMGEILVVILLLKIILLNNGLIQMNLLITNKLADKSLLLMYTAGILGSLLIVYISKNIQKYHNKFIDIISKNTLFIIFFHFWILFITSWLKLPKLLLILNNKLVFLFCIFYSCIILLLSYIVISIFLKYCPIIVGKNKC